MFPSAALTRARRRASCLFVLTTAGILAPHMSSADEVVRWNLRATIAAADAHLDPATEASMFAVMHTAIFDAVNAVLRYGPAYSVRTLDAAGAHAPAAAVSAAHVVLSTFLPADRATFDAALAQELAAMPEGPARDLGVAAGRQAADLVMARWTDTRPDATGWTEVLELLAWGCDMDEEVRPDELNSAARPDESRTQVWNRRGRARASSRTLSLWENARFFAALNRALVDGRDD
jgi:hypothetical protein